MNEPRQRTFLRLAAAFLSGCCMWAGVPDMDLWWLGFIGWIPWLWAIQGLSPKRAFLYGMFTGTVALFVGFFWLTELLTRFAGFGMALAIPTTPSLCGQPRAAVGLSSRAFGVAAEAKRSLHFVVGSAELGTGRMPAPEPLSDLHGVDLVLASHVDPDRRDRRCPYRHPNHGGHQRSRVRAASTRLP